MVQFGSFKGPVRCMAWIIPTQLHYVLEVGGCFKDGQGTAGPKFPNPNWSTRIPKNLLLTIPLILFKGIFKEHTIAYLDLWSWAFWAASLDPRVRNGTFCSSPNPKFKTPVIMIMYLNGMIDNTD